MNPYLKAKREQYAALESTITGVQTRAAAENRDMNADELRSVKEQTELAKTLYAEVEMLTEQENRSAAFNDMAVKLRPQANGISADERDPGHYRSVKDGAKIVPVGNSWFGDLYRSSVLHDAEATRRMTEHTSHLRSNDTTSTVPGVIQPTYFTELFTVMMQQGAVLSALAPSTPLPNGNSFYLPGQTGVTTIVSQTESTALTPGDAYTATYGSGAITPLTLTADEVVSRQLLDGSNPGIDALILSDFARSLTSKKEALIGTAVLAVGSAIAEGLIAFNAPTNAASAWSTVTAAGVDVRKVLFERADSLVCDYDFFQVLLGLKDSQGRPLMVSPANGPQNAAGVGNLMNDGYFAGLPVFVSGGMKGGTVTTYYGAALASRYVQQFESAIQQFVFTEKRGPAQIELAAWQYWNVAVRQATRAVKNITVDSLT